MLKIESNNFNNRPLFHEGRVGKVLQTLKCTSQTFWLTTRMI